MANRYFIELSYDGNDYHGWQIQPNAKTIQETLNLALSTILRTDIYAIGCGRTDTGVHASQFFAHFDSEQLVADTETLTYKLNRMLPMSIAVKRLFPVATIDHARFSASSRTYVYKITREKDPFAVNRMWELRDELDVDAMNRGAQIIMGYTDFSCFAKSRTQTETNDCTIYSAHWIEAAPHLVFEIQANRFLRNMVRAIVGTLILMGKGLLSESDLHQLIASKNRSEAGTSVPAHGLYLTNISYPEGTLP